ncbi:hypothetical protein J7K93_03660 [bacterium]|nr:hypothetical protein [bacterium]
MDILKILQNLWLKDSKVKLFSLLIALFLWFYVVTDNYFTHTVKIPLFLINKPTGWILTHSIPESISVEVKGNGKDIIRFIYSKKKLLINLKNIKQTKTYNLNVNMIEGMPENSRITPVKIVSPKKVKIELDKFSTKKIPVNSCISLNPLNGYIQVGSIVLEPDSILISGPRSQLNEIKSISTDSVFYKRITKDFSKEVNLVNPANDNIEISCKKVKFKARFQRIGERIFQHIPVNFVNVPSGVSAMVVPSALTLKLQAGVGVLTSIDPSMIKAEIDYRSINKYSRNKIRAVIELPDNIITYQAKPQFFEIIVNQ